MNSKVIRNKDVIQSYIMTTAKYDFNVYEKRIIFRLVESIQGHLEGKKLNTEISIQKLASKDRIVTMPISAFLIDENDKNHNRVKTALTRLRNKTFEFDNGKVWKLIGIIEKPNFDYAGLVQFELQSEVYNALLDFSKGFRKYELKTAMQFESVYSMRFYELLSGQTQPIEYKIETLKSMFGLEDKYKLNADFFRSVINIAKKELDRCSPYTFDYTPKKRGRAYHSILFIPKYQPQFRDEDLEKKELSKRSNISWYLTRNEKNYLIQNIGFSEKGIKNNAVLIERVKALKIKQRINFIDFLSTIKDRALRSDAHNIQGYVISALKSETEED